MGPWAIDWTSPYALIGNSLLLCAALSWALVIIAMRRWPPVSSMFTLLPWCFLIGAVTIAPLVGWEAPYGSFGAPHAWWVLAYIGLIAGPLGTWGTMQATAILPAIVTSIGFLATPALGILLSAWILGETISIDLIVGAGLILIGVGLAAWPERVDGNAAVS